MNKVVIKYLIISTVTLALIISAFILFRSVPKDVDNSTALSTTASTSADLIIVKSDISTSKFYPYKIGNTNMEIIALKASDGTIRTAFNTCQVCFSSGKGYYKVVGDTLVCQNCGNVFKFDQVEKQRGGCNPVPILAENKIDDGTKITISQTYLEQSKQIFANWKK